jgi:PKD repeat protein
MNLLKASSGPASPRRAALFLVVAALVLQGGAASAQCTLIGSISKFEPNPAGTARPSYMNWIGINGFSLNQPSGGQPRLLVTEAFGYHQVDLTDPANPQVLGWEDYRFSPTNPGPVPCSGDCHSGVNAMGISDDGARAAFALNGNVDSPNATRTMLGLTGGTDWQIALRAETASQGGNSVAIQHIGSRYLAYTFSNSAVYVSDVTNLPASLVHSTNFAAEQASGSGGTTPVLAGPYIVSLGNNGFGSTGAINLINVASPGPAGNIVSGFASATVSSTDGVWGRPSTEKIFAFHAAADPSNSSAIYILAEFADSSYHSAGYSVIRYVGGSATLIGTFRIPVQTGESWGIGYTVSLFQSGGSLFALMWGARIAPTPVFRLFSSPVTAFGAQAPGTIDVDPASYSGFGTGYPMAGLATSNKLYLYVPSGQAGWIVPTSCVSTNSPAVSSLSVSSYGSPLSSGATVFIGDEVDIATAVAPAPSQQALTGFRWNLDLDFHTGAAVEDAGTTPRIKNPDNGAVSGGPAPPTAITLIGPCDPANGSTSPGSGAGCWTSVTTNGRYTQSGQPDFAASPPAGSSTALTIALEANNQYGTAGTATFGLSWKVPAAKLLSSQILAGGTLVSASDGHPSAYQWSFGPDAQNLTASCTTSSCAPPSPYNVRGTYAYSLTTKYYSDQAFTTTTTATYTVTDFAPAFSVNGSTTGPITAITNQSLSVSNSSQRGGTVTGAGGFYYSFCATPCADNYVLWGTMGDAPPGGSPPYSAAIPVPGTPGTYALKIKVGYGGSSSGTAFWPDPTGSSSFPVNVTNVIPEIRFDCVVGFQCTDINSVSVNTGDTVYAYAYVNGGKDSSPPASLSWSMSGASPGTCFGANCQPAQFSYGSAGTYTVTMDGYGSQVAATVRVTQRSTPPSVSAFANPSSAAVNQQISFTCSATGGSGSYGYSWSVTDGGTGSGSSYSHAFAASGSYSATCTARDNGTGLTGSSQVNVTIGGSGGGSCSGVSNLFHSTDPQFPDTPNIGQGFSVAWGAAITFIANSGYGSYSWDFGDGQLGTGQSVTHTYPQAAVGNRTIALTVDGCTKSYPIAVTGSSAPVVSCSGATFSITGATYQAADQFGTPAGWRGVGVGATTAFVATNPTNATSATYDWNWGDGTTHGTGQSATHAYAHAGTFTTTLTISATDATGTTGPCLTSFDIIVSGPSGAFQVRYEDNSVFIASNVTGYKNVVFTATDPGSIADAYLWDFGDGTAHQTDQIVTHSFAPGSWTVTLTVTKGAGSASTTQPLTVVAPPEPPKWVVPGMAYVLGQVPGTVWQSDVTIFNPDPTRTATYSITFLDARNAVVDYSKLTWSAPIQVPALGSVSSSNLLGQTFGQPLGAYGALMVRGDVAPAPPVITARTFNNGDPTKGTFGLSVPATSVTGGVSSQAAAAASVLIGLRQNAAAYTNLGLVNLRNDWPKVELDFTDGQSSALLASMTVDLQPYQSLQINRALQAAGFAGTSDEYTVKVKILQGSAVYPFATVIDAASTDPIVVTPYDSPSNSYRVPGIVRLTGANGEQWRSRFTIGNPSLTARSAHLRYSYIPCDASGCKSRVTIDGDFQMSPGQSLWTDDFVAVWLSNNAGIVAADTTSYQSSFLDVTPSAGDPNQEPLVVLGETYNATPNGHVGLQIPGYTPQDGASRTGANKRLVLTGLASTAAYRTNLALFVVAGATGKWCNVHVYSAQGTKLRDIAVLVDSFAQVSSGTLFGGLSGDLSRLSVVVDNMDDGVTVGGYATIIDNTSGDATFVKGQPAP